MAYLLDADTLIRADRQEYPIGRFPVFWDWLSHHGENGTVKIPLEQYEEVTAGRGDIVDWLRNEDNRRAMLLAEEADPAAVARVLVTAYGDLNEVEIQRVGRDPFLIAYACADLGQRTVVTFEVSAPGQRRGKRKIPDACNDLGVPSCNLFGMIQRLDFTTNWRP